MKNPILETTPRAPNESFHCEVVRGRGYGARWHFHPECQITLVLKSSGYRVVGDHVAPLTPGDLVLVGANVPHVWHQDPEQARSKNAVHAIVVRFREDFLGDDFMQSPELAAARRLLKRASRGLCVTGRTLLDATTLMQALPDASGLGRITLLLQLLDRLAGSRELRPLAAANFTPLLKDGDQPRMQRVMRFIHDHLEEGISREDAARAAGLSEGAFSRFFKTRAGMTLPRYVNELRVGRACTRLASTDDKVADVALDCGFENLANFNRQFQLVTGMAPRVYRARFRRHVSGDDMTS